VQLDLGGGGLQGPELQPGRHHDATAALQTAAVPARALRLADLGYFALEVFAQIAAGGGYWLSRLHGSTTLYTATGEPLDLTTWLTQQSDPQIERLLQLGAKQHLPCRLLGARVPQEGAAQRRRRLRQDAQRRGHTPGRV
jgi:hypothetical protein